MTAASEAGVEVDSGATTTRTTTAVRRRFLVAAGIGAALAVVLFVLVMQSGRAGLLDRDLLGNFYDGQARALMDGHVDVDPDIPGFEGFRIGDETHIYQGITPSIVRIPLLALTDRFDGRLTGLSMIAAFVVALSYVVAAGWLVRRTIRGAARIGTTELVCTAIATFGIGCGSLLFLASNAWVYHEALLWGTALCLGSLTHLSYWMLPEGRVAAGHRLPQLAGAVVLAGLTINTRSSVGLGPIAALGLASVGLVLAIAARSAGAVRLRDLGVRLSGWDTTRSTSAPVASLGIVVVGVLASVVLYAGINQARFDSPFGVPLDKQALVATDIARQEALAANDNSLFGVQYAPSVLTQVLRPDAIGLRSQFPFVGFPESRPAVVGDAVFAELDWSSSLPASEPLLFWTGLLGLVVLVVPGWVSRRRHRRDPECDQDLRAIAALRIPVVGAAIGGSVIVVFGYIAQRYLTDLYPLLVLAGLVGMHTIGTWLFSRTAQRSTARTVGTVGVIALLVVASAWTAWANTGMALQYHSEVAPGLTERQRSDWLRLQDRWGGSFDIVDVPAGAELPPAGGVGQLAVVGECDAMYRSNGTVWYLVESGEAADGYRLTLERDGQISGPTVLTRSTADADGASSQLVVEPLGGDQVRLVVEVDRDGAITRSLVGQPFELPDRSTTQLDLSMDWRTDNVVVTLVEPATEVLRVQIDLPPTAVESVGDDVISVRAAGSPTPLCDRLSA